MSSNLMYIIVYAGFKKIKTFHSLEWNSLEKFLENNYLPIH